MTRLCRKADIRLAFLMIAGTIKVVFDQAYFFARNEVLFCLVSFLLELMVNLLTCVIYRSSTAGSSKKTQIASVRKKHGVNKGPFTHG